MPEKAKASCESGVSARKLRAVSALHAQNQVHTREHRVVNQCTAMRLEIDMESLRDLKAAGIRGIAVFRK